MKKSDRLKKRVVAKGVTRTPGVCGGRPCIAGTRLPTDIMLHAALSTLERDYPTGTRAGFKAALAYELLCHEHAWFRRMVRQEYEKMMDLNHHHSFTLLERINNRLEQRRT